MKAAKPTHRLAAAAAAVLALAAWSAAAEPTLIAMTPSNYPHDTPNYDENHSCMKRDYGGKYYMDRAACGDGKHVAFLNGAQRWLNTYDNGQRVAWGAFDPVKSCWWLKPAAICSGWFTPNLSPQTSARFSYVVSKATGGLLMHTECLLWTKPEAIALTWPAPGDFCWNVSAVPHPVAPAPVKRGGWGTGRGCVPPRLLATTGMPQLPQPTTAARRGFLRLCRRPPQLHHAHRMEELERSAGGVHGWRRAAGHIRDAGGVGGRRSPALVALAGVGARRLPRHQQRLQLWIPLHARLDDARGHQGRVHHLQLDLHFRQPASARRVQRLGSAPPGAVEGARPGCRALCCTSCKLRAASPSMLAALPLTRAPVAARRRRMSPAAKPGVASTVSC